MDHNNGIVKENTLKMSVGTEAESQAKWGLAHVDMSMYLLFSLIFKYFVN